MAEQHTLTVLISGSGSNLRALIRACASNHLPNTSIVRVIYNRKAAENGVGIAAAKEAGIPATYHNLLAFEKEDEKEYRKAHGIGVDEGLGEAQKREMKSKARERYDRASASLM